MSILNRRFLTGAICTLAVIGLALPVAAQSKDEKKRQKELQEALQREARPVLMLVDSLQRQQGPGDAQAFTVNPKEDDPAKAMTVVAPAVDPKGIGWRTDMMKAADGKVYVPYTITFPAATMPSGPISRVRARGPQGRPATHRRGQG